MSNANEISQSITIGRPKAEGDKNFEHFSSFLDNVGGVDFLTVWRRCQKSQLDIYYLKIAAGEFCGLIFLLLSFGANFINKST